MSFTHSKNSAFLLSLAGVFLFLSPAFALDKVVWKPKPDAEEQTAVGRALEVAQDGGILFQFRDGSIEAMEPGMVVKATRSDEPFIPMTQDEVAAKVLAGMPPGFQIHKSAHYVVCYNTSPEYARWCASLMERLYTGFTYFWKNQGRGTLPAPEFPLVMLIFADKQQYKTYGKDELGDAADAIIGYYSYSSNRIVCYDLTGRENLGLDRKNRSAMGVAREILKRPDAESLVATIVHEATHQLAFNRGVFSRYADVPLWYNEGIAMFFEVPDLKNAKGWQGMGKVNPFRMPLYRDYLKRRPAGALQRLLTDDNILRKPETTAEGYAEAWALTYFLIKTRKEKYVQYSQLISAKKTLRWDDPEVRIRDFETCFGKVEDVEKAFVRYMGRQ